MVWGPPAGTALGCQARHRGLLLPDSGRHQATTRPEDLAPDLSLNTSGVNFTASLGLSGPSYTTGVS